MLSSLRRCAVTLTQIHTSKIKVTQDIMCNKFNILINNGQKCDNIFITYVFLFKSSKTMLWRDHKKHVSLYWKYLRLVISSMLQIKDSFSFFFSQNNLGIDLTYTTYNLNNFNKYPFITCSYTQEYFGYRSNNLYFLFSHSWPVVVYICVRFNVPVRLREKQNVLKNNGGRYSRPLDCLVCS